MTDLVGCVKDIGKCILTQCIQPYVKRHFDYWWCFDDNIQSLRDGIRDLGREAYNINQKIEEARLGTEILRPGIVEWLKASTKKLDEAQNILLPDDHIPKTYNLISRYSLGKNAKKTAEEIAKLRNDGDFNTIADPAPPPAMGTQFHRLTVEFESRKSIEKNIIDSLKKSSVDMIGICGMGGVGKTTMAQRIGKSVQKQNLFDEVVMVTVSQTIDIPKIRNEIASLLKLKFDETSTPENKLRMRLMDEKRKLIIFDDVWESLEFEKLGIPIESNFERCKVLLTSRSRDTCRRIKNKVVFDLKILEEEEAWLLFKDKAGDCVEGSRLKPVAKKVAAECKGLPIALVTVGLTLQDTTDVHTWENSLSQLRKANPEDFPEVLRDVYNPLKVSYDGLNSDRERNLFLLCCLFPEDFNIPVEQLTWYSMGLGLFDGVDNIKEARNRTHTLVGKLESRFLLIDVEKEGKKGVEVKMHDVIRDVAIDIGSREKDGFLKSLTSIENSSDGNCNWMSVDISYEQMEVPVLSRFPKLRLLMLLTLSSNQFGKKFYDISHISFEGMKNLNVLCFESISNRSLPATLESLENLQTLRLFDCEVENISVIGNLTSLKILSCCKCENIKELPAEIGRLKDLRLLELNRCSNFLRIPFGIISSLSVLEELKIYKSFSIWETGGERRYASLTELEGLRNLTCLEIHIPDCTLSAQEIRLSQKLVRYRIRIHDEAYYDFEDRDYENEMNLKLPGAVGNWIQLLARNAESLSLRGDGSDNINLAEMENLRILRFINCSTVKKLVESSYLNQNDSLCNLKSIYISGCDNLRYLFSVWADRRSLLQLEVLEIRYCKSMEQVFLNEIRDDNTDGCIEFPKLKELSLVDLPNLTAFCQGLENIIVKFPNLTEMEIRGLPKLKRLLSPPNSEILENTCFHLFCNPNPKEVSLGNLKSIFIESCCNLRCLFSVSAAGRYLLQLEDLSIQECESMEQVFWNVDNINGCIEFPKLKKLILWNLPNLTAFCQGFENFIIHFPNLTQMWITKLPKLNILFPPNSKDLLQLEFLWIDDCESMEQVIWSEGTYDNTDGCIEFPKLKELRLWNLPNLTAFCQRLENNIIKFPNLTQMWITNLPKLNSLFPPNSKINQDDNLRYLFPASMARKCLLQLEVLWIKDCESMEQLFWNEGTDDKTDGCIIEFPKLESLSLSNLPNLTAFCQGLENIIIKFPNLTELEIGGLPKLNSLSPLNSETVVWHDQNTSFHFVCNPKVEMGLLKSLTLSTLEDNIKNIWCHQIPNNFFNNLERLHISFMNGIKSSMSTSIAKNLVSLKVLRINNCKEMVEVIEIDDDNDKQVVDINCLFPNLSELKLNSLHKLIRFWQWDHALELPLLESIYISYCPVMETFTLGSIITPNIRKISINYIDIEDHKDLNDVIRHMRPESRDTFGSKEDWIDEDGNEENKDENTEESKDEYDNDNVNKDRDDDVNVNKVEDDNERK